jgi:hypothetical protein
LPAPKTAITVVTFGCSPPHDKGDPRRLRGAESESGDQASSTSRIAADLIAGIRATIKQAADAVEGAKPVTVSTRGSSVRSSRPTT